MPQLRLETRTFRTTGGRAAAIKLEPEIWALLEMTSECQGKTVAQIISDIDDRRGKFNRADAIRVYILNFLCHSPDFGRTSGATIH